MGLAASQTRFLQLTARKSNVEFEGQQVNQSRTVLSNQSANLFEELLTLKSPQVPSSYGVTAEEYNEDLASYNVEQNVYDGKIEEINAKTSIIHEQDKNLELRLKQLDSEQEAIQTEMDSVKKVIDKNIEQTFKTFA